FFFFQAEDGIRDRNVTGVQTCALPISIPVAQGDMEHADMLTDWLESYKPEELFNEDGSPKEIVTENTAKGEHRMAMNPITNGGLDPKRLNLPDYRKFALKFDKPGSVEEIGRAHV